jgi:hypothetical protein
MKIKLACHKCMLDRDADRLPRGPVPANEYYYLPVSESNIYQYTCIRGHQNTAMLQDQKFDLLIQSAANAICDGYLRESVASLASALERLHEYAITLFCLKYQISFESIEEVSSQTERQLGAYMFLYLYVFKRKPHLLKTMVYPID